MDKILYKRTITLAQQLDIKLFAISTLATIAWSYKQESQNLSVQMRGQKGQLFTAIYQLGEIRQDLP
jgi:tRNA A37 threonylcarbamoyladenosine modification protein TsaB